MEGVNRILDESITGVSIPSNTAPLLDLSKIDFNALAGQFAKSRTKNTEVEVLKAAIRAKLGEMLSLNRTRADYLAKFEELIEAYNSSRC